MNELAQLLIPSIATGVVTGLVAWGGVRVQLRYLARDVTRAHRRLDLIRAPNVTLERAE